MKNEVIKVAVNASTVEDILRVVLQDGNSEIFKAGGELTVCGEKAYDHLQYILLAVSQFLEGFDVQETVRLRPKQVDNFMEDLEKIIKRGY